MKDITENKKDIFTAAKNKAVEMLEDEKDILNKTKEYIKEKYEQSNIQNSLFGDDKLNAIPPKAKKTKTDGDKELRHGRSVIKDNIENTINELEAQEKADHEQRAADIIRCSEQKAEERLVNICRREIEKEKKNNRSLITWIISAGVFFSCLTLYTTLITLNNTGWINNLNGSMANMQTTMLHESVAVNKLINQVARTAGIKPEENKGMFPCFNNAACQDCTADGFNILNGRKRNVTDMQILPQPQLPEPQYAVQPQYIQQEQPAVSNTSVEDNAAETANKIAGITYQMYTGVSLQDRVNILSTHFNTNIVLIEYMLRTMAQNSGVRGEPKTPEQVRANLQAILNTDAGRKIESTYNVWQTVKNDPQVLVNIDKKLVDNGFYGLPFIAAVEKALAN